MLHCHHNIFSPYHIFTTFHNQHQRHRHSHYVSLNSIHKTTNLHSLSALPGRSLNPCLALFQPSDPITPPEVGGPIQLPPSSPSIFATTDDPSPLQVATSILLTGAIAVFLFRSLRRRAKRAKELKFRSSGAKKTLKEEALDNLKAMGSASIEATKPPSPVQALLGGIAAGVIALILYKFTTTVEAALNRQTMSDNLSVRQITITIRTIVNGLCYLATFVFGINSVGLFLYAAQLAINSFMEGTTSEETESKVSGQSGSSSSTSEIVRDGAELTNSQGDQNPDSKQ